MREINHFNDFIKELRTVGFTIGGENGEGVFTLSDAFGESIAWHTEDPETDPWEWRIRVLDEYTDIAYGKLFFRKSGYITKEWYPYFLAVRRGKKELQEEYEEGNVTIMAKRIYDVLSEEKELPVHLLKQYGGFSGEDKSGFDKALTQLQMDFYIPYAGGQGSVPAAGKNMAGHPPFSALRKTCLERRFSARPENYLMNRPSNG